MLRNPLLGNPSHGPETEKKKTLVSRILNMNAFSYSKPNPGSRQSSIDHPDSASVSVYSPNPAKDTSLSVAPQSTFHLPPRKNKKKKQNNIDKALVNELNIKKEMLSRSPATQMTSSIDPEENMYSIPETKDPEQKETSGCCSWLCCFFKKSETPNPDKAASPNLITMDHSEFESSGKPTMNFDCCF